jgi:hypothetical protein
VEDAGGPLENVFPMIWSLFEVGKEWLHVLN